MPFPRVFVLQGAASPILLELLSLSPKDSRSSIIIFYSETCVQFGLGDNDLISFGSRDGLIYVCAAYLNPRVLNVLRGHTAAITGNPFFSYSTNGYELTIWF